MKLQQGAKGGVPQAGRWRHAPNVQQQPLPAERKGVVIAALHVNSCALQQLPVQLALFGTVRPRWRPLVGPKAASATEEEAALSKGHQRAHLASAGEGSQLQWPCLARGRLVATGGQTSALLDAAPAAM